MSTALLRITLVLVTLGSAAFGLAACSTSAASCTWNNTDGGTIECPADGKTSCASGYDCNTCKCNADGTRGGCTTLVCP